ncbi:Golgi phosphoprotein 3 (GPP34) [Saccharopolyspora antimicrobica]|uniref:Golgi phosphoprotein 3 (GPP34) n=2 Tax=Saccharopolyspora antimicrobica TaxID=455193 RepID=A0A1I5D5D3_9PSEU|nr:Golgi phosphoprotein 3 GPP34 [Saccharopolyspora antimicrobica]SFN94458.1 Golgi phosphoprotein 3 (GPP34) [Saccharopolyspora antimicrobica]
MNEMLLVEDLMMLLLDDETGVPAAAGTLHYSLGGAVLVELALRGSVDSDGSTALNGPKISAVEGAQPEDPLLRSGYDKIAEKPRRVQPLLLEIGSGLRKPVLDRLLERGVIRVEKKKVLGVFPMTRMPAEDTGHEAELRRKIRAALEDGETPDSRTGALIALLSSSGALPALSPPLAWSGEVAKRAKEFEEGNWGAEAVNTAVLRTAAAIAASTTVTTITSTS